MFQRMPSDHPLPTCYRCNELIEKAARLELKPAASIIYTRYRVNYAKHVVVVTAITMLCVPALVVGGGLSLGYTDSLFERAIGAFIVSLFGIPMLSTFIGLMKFSDERERLMRARSRSESGS